MNGVIWKGRLLAKFAPTKTGTKIFTKSEISLTPVNNAGHKIFLTLLFSINFLTFFWSCLKLFSLWFGATEHVDKMHHRDAQDVQRKESINPLKRLLRWASVKEDKDSAIGTEMMWHPVSCLETKPKPSIGHFWPVEGFFVNPRSYWELTEARCKPHSQKPQVLGEKYSRTTPLRWTKRVN